MNIANNDANGANRLLGMLPVEDWQAIKKFLTVVTPPTGTILQEIGEPMDHVYFPHSGMISLLTVMKDGRAIETATIGNEGAVGAEMALGVTTAITRGVVQIAMTASRISRKDFMKCVERRTMIQSLAFRSNEALIGQTQQTAACNALHQIEARLARWLLQSQDRAPAKGMVPLTQEFLSEMLAVRINFVGEGTPSRLGLADWLVASLSEKRTVPLFEDVLFNPLYAGDLPELLVALARSSERGVVNLGCSGDGLSKAAFARGLAERLSLSLDSARSGKLSDGGLMAQRPLDTRMDVGRADRILGTRLPDAETVMDRMAADISRRRDRAA